MAYSVSSWFVDTLGSRNLVAGDTVRQLYVASQDLSAYVNKWPTISRKWNDIRPQTLTIRLAGESQDINWLVTSKMSIRREAAINFGLVTDSGTNETISMFAGKLQSAQFNEGSISIALVNKFKQLSERTVGTPNSAYNYTGSNHFICDLTWYLMTSHGGLDATQSTSNVDINYSGFLDWASIMSGDNVRASAYLDGKKCTELLKNIGDMTQTAIYEEEGKINFRRFTLADSYTTVITPATLLKSSGGRSDNDMVNAMKVSANYDVNSRYFSIGVQDVSSSSVNSYGLREDIYDNTNVWFTDSVSALNLAQRVTTVYGQPPLTIRPVTLMHGFLRQVGEMVDYNDPLPEIGGGFRILEYKKDLDNGTMEMVLQDSQIQGGFILDSSSLDGSDVLV